MAAPQILVLMVQVRILAAEQPIARPVQRTSGRSAQKVFPAATFVGSARHRRLARVDGMNDTTRHAIAAAEYIGSTAVELAAKRRGDRVAAGVDQRVLFARRGRITLTVDALRLEGWGEQGDLFLHPADVLGVANRFTALYGRFAGGLLNAGKPLILETTVGEIYLMVDHRTFMETTDNRRWAALIETWRRG
jgi:hypothetical protein